MRRSARPFRATVLQLEERALQTSLPSPSLPSPSPTYVAGFGVSLYSPPRGLIQEVSQQSGVARVLLTRLGSGIGSSPVLKVRVTTDPTSPHVGVNFGAVDQVVTFAPGQMSALLEVPIIAGAPNPGSVDVNLTMTPVDPPPDLNISVPVQTLRILAFDAPIPPAIVATNGTPRGIEVIFNKPMDPVKASNIKNYSIWTETPRMSPFIPFFQPPTGRLVLNFVRLKSAEYDPAANKVTLIPKRPLSYDKQLNLQIDARPVRVGPGPKPVHRLVDMAGHTVRPNNMVRGKFRVPVVNGYTVTYLT